MSVREYIGARYVPIFADPLEWDGTKTYEPLTVVLHQGNSYTSRQAVPVGIEITNSTYWAQTGNYSAQVEQYRAEVAAFDGRITANATAITTETSARENADTALDGRITANASAISTEATARENADTALDGRVTANASAISAETSARESADSALDARVTANATAISTEATARADADTALDARVTANASRIFSTPAFDIADRWIVNDANTLSNVGIQTGCVFEQNGVLYSANIVKDDGDSSTGCNKLVIRNVEAHTTVGTLSYDFKHGSPISYNPEQKLLLTSTTAEETSLLIFISTATISAPSVVSTKSYAGISGFGSATCWYGNNILNITNFSFDCRIYDTDLNLLDSFSLEHYPLEQGYTYQAQATYDKYLVVAVSDPEAIYIFDLEQRKQVNIVNMPANVGHTRVYELEGIAIDDTNIYVLNGSYIDEFAVVSWLRWNYVSGNLEQSDQFRIRNQKYATLTVDWTNGDLIDPLDSGKFKLLGDAICYLKDVYNDQAQPTINFASDYPVTLRFTGFNGVVNLGTYTYVAAIFALCKCSISGACQFTTTGDAITIAWNSQVSIQTAYTKTGNAPNATTAVRALDSYIITNQTLNNVYFTRCIFARLTQPAIHQYGSVAELSLVNENVTG